MKLPSLFVTALLFVFACGGNPTLDRVNETRAKAQARPGAAQVVAYAIALRHALDEKAFEKPAAGARLGDEAIAMIDAAAQASPAEAPELIGYKGLLLVSLGRHRPAWAAFQESMRLGPNFIAAGNIVIVYGTANKPDKVAETCSESVPYLAKKGDVDELYRFIELCNKNMNALDDRRAMAWANQPTREFYQAERERRRRAWANKVEADEQQRAEETRVMNEMEMCTSSCREQTALCQADCGRRRVCRNDCVTANNACVDRCAARAKRELGLRSGY